MTTSSYDQIATWYNESVRNGSLIHDLAMPGIFTLLGEIAGQHICDLACGQGFLARQLARRGATVVGIDLSQQLLQMARHDETQEPLGIVYLHDDAQALHTVTDASFDGVICNVALMDIADLAATFRAVQRILRPAGWFVCSITHPCFQTPLSSWTSDQEGTVSRVVSGYFEEKFWRSDNPEGVRGQVGAYHRTLSTYVNTLVEAGLALESILEPQATGAIAERVPGYKEVPAMLLMRCRKL
ncbi:MAG: class I SAM-dependent methyltransferase [Ktedonobacteraceae bacterium]